MVRKMAKEIKGKRKRVKGTAKAKVQGLNPSAMAFLRNPRYEPI